MFRNLIRDHSDGRKNNSMQLAAIRNKSTDIRTLVYRGRPRRHGRHRYI